MCIRDRAWTQRGCLPDIKPCGCGDGQTQGPGLAWNPAAFGRARLLVHSLPCGSWSRDSNAGRKGPAKRPRRSCRGARIDPGQERSFDIQAADFMRESIAQIQVRQQPKVLVNRLSLKKCKMPSKSRKTAGALEVAGSIIRRSARKPIAPGEGVYALRKRVTSAQSLVDRATSSKSPASSS